MPRERVVVIGGGIVGLSCAWFLNRAGAEVTVLEAADRTGAGASRGNAGAICPSMTEPLAGPDAVRAVLRDLGRPDAALHVHPSVMPKMAGFIRRFTQAATPAAFERGLLAMVALARGVTEAYDELAESGIGSSARLDGYLTLHATADGAAAERTNIERMASLGACRPPGPILDGAAIRAMEPLVSERVVAGFLLPGERWIDAGVFVDELTSSLTEGGVAIRTSCAVEGVVDLGDGIEIDTALGTVDADRVVIAAGAWTRELVAPLGMKLPLYPGKGYSFAVRPDRLPDHVLHLPDAHVMLTPYPDRLRIAGTMEFDGTMDRFNGRRIDAMVRATAPLLREVDLEDRSDEWVGPRPVTPDGLPILGPVPGHPRVVLATGHNMLGVTLAPITGQLVSQLVTAGDAGADLAPFSPGRF